MNLIIFCTIFCFPTTLSFQLTFYEVNQKNFQYEIVPTLVCSRHQFMYKRGDNITMYLQLLNDTSPPTEAVTVVKTRPGTMGCRTKIDEVTRRITIKWQLKTELITVDLELFTKDGCLRQTILEGREMPADDPDSSKRHNICRNANQCVAIVNMGYECSDMKPQPCEVTSNRMPRFSTPAPLDKLDDSLNDTNEMWDILNMTVLAAINILNSLESPTQNISSASSSTAAETSYFTVMIITSITAAVALILLLVFATRHFCRKTYNSPGLPQIPVNEDRYYENMLFRADCQQQIEQLEQRPLEDPQPSELQYEEINNCSNRW